MSPAPVGLPLRLARVVARNGLLIWEIVAALAVMPFIELSLRRSDLRTTCHRLGLTLDLDSATPPATIPVVLPRRSRHRLRAAALVTRYWPADDTCLRRCLLLGHRLRGRGPVLRIGVRRRPDGGFAAHSWLELDGATFDPGAAEFAVLGTAEQVDR